jgi:hypothetical protein
MDLSNNLNDGLVQYMDRKCGTNVTSFPYGEKIAYLNSALERYFYLGLGFNIDDTRNTASPIDFSSLISSGTNYFKITSFGEEINKILKVAYLSDTDYVASVVIKEKQLIEEHLDSLSDSFHNLYLASITGEPSYFIRVGDFIYVRPNPTNDYYLGIMLERSAYRFAFKSFTVTVASPGVFTCTGHGLVAGDKVILRTDGILPTGLTAGNIYYVISTGLTTSAFQLSTTLGGTAINTSATQSGNHSFIKINQEPGIPETFHDFLWQYASMQYCIDKGLNQKEDLKQLVSISENEITKYFSYLNRETLRGFSPNIENCR